MHRIYFLMVFALFLASCAPAANSSTQQPVLSLPTTASEAGTNPQANPQLTAVTPSEFAEMLGLLNQARSQARACGSERYESAGKLSYNPLLSQSAYLHAEDMHQKAFFGHTGSDGSDVSARVTRTGYNWARVGENLAYGAPKRYVAKDIVEGWLASPGHCENIMNPEFREVGLAKLTTTYDYWVHVFGVSQ